MEAVVVQICNAEGLHPKAIQSRILHSHTREVGSTARAICQARSGSGLHLYMDELGKDATNVACAIVEGCGSSVEMDCSVEGQSSCVLKRWRTFARRYMMDELRFVQRALGYG